MAIYIFLPLFLLFLIIFKGKNKVYVAILLLFAINVCRDYSVGYDYGINYKRMYEYINTDSYKILASQNEFNLLSVKSKDVEIGWAVLQFIGKSNDLPFSFVNFLAAIIIFTNLIYVIRKSPIPILSVLLYVLLFRYYASFNIIRQSLAAIIFIAIIPYIINRQFYKYLLGCLFAASFHLSSLMMIVFYFLPKIKISFKSSMILIISTYIISGLNLDTKLFSLLYNSGYMFTAYAKYLNIVNDYNYNIIYLYIPSILLLTPYVSLSSKICTNALNTYQLLYLFAIIISILSVHYEVLFRFNEYFLNALIITIPLLLKEQSKAIYRPQYCIVLMCFILYYSMYLFLNANAIWPYSLIF